VDLLERRRVHEIEVVGVVVEVLHLALVERGAFEVLLRPELLVRQGGGADVPHPRLDEAPLVARGEVLDVEDPEQIVADLDEIALAQTGCLDGSHSEQRSGAMCAGRTLRS
jgi:hypothetical protein